MIGVNIRQARTHLSRYIDRVEKGVIVVVCRQLAALFASRVPSEQGVQQLPG
jgi:antitoxin (DNA-binding transcriptional repressor) of toxin-antitoxin stability system